MENNAQKEEEDYMNALKQIEELKTLNRSTFREDEDYTTLNKQLQDTQEYLLFIESKHKKMLQLRTCIKKKIQLFWKLKRKQKLP